LVGALLAGGAGYSDKEASGDAGASRRNGDTHVDASEQLAVDAQRSRPSPTARLVDRTAVARSARPSAGVELDGQQVAGTPPPRRTGSPSASFGVGLEPVRPATGPLCAGPGWERRRGAIMLARIRYPYWGLAFSIQFMGARNGYLGYTSYGDRRIEIYVRPCSQESDEVLTHTIGHEIGHAVDYTFGDAARRARWQSIRGIPASTPWYGCAACTDYDTPAGDFAETFAYWQVGPVGYRSTLVRPPSQAQLEAVGALFWP